MGSLGSIRSGNPLSRGQPSGQTLSPVPQEVAAVILCCRREGNGPLQTQFGPPLQSPEARAAASLIVIVTVMPPSPNLASRSRGCAAGPVGLGRSQTSSSARRLCGRGQVTEPLCPSAPVSETGECDRPPEGL